MRKKSAKRASEEFKLQAERIKGFLDKNNLSSFSDAHATWAYDYGIIRLYREFEDMILSCLVAAINSDTQQLSSTTGVDFPKHITDEVCEFIVVGDGYFDFRGRDGLIKTLKKFLPIRHYLVTIAKDPAYKDALDRLSALRNFAAHDSKPSKKGALNAIGGKRLASSGAWLKRQDRFGQISNCLIEFADAVYQQAPF